MKKRLRELWCGFNHLATLDLSNLLFERLDIDDQVISAKCTLKDGKYILDMNRIVGSENLTNVTFVDGTNYDSVTGLVTLDSLPAYLNYNYNVNNHGMMMQVCVDITAVNVPIPVDTDNDEKADTEVEAAPDEGLIYVDEEGNIYIPVDSNVEDGNIDGEMDFYVEVTENAGGDYPYTDSFGNDYIPVDFDGDGEPDVYVKVAGDEDNDGKPEDEAGNEYEGVDTDDDGKPDHWEPAEDVGYTMSLAAPTEKYAAAADYFAAAKITVTGATAGQPYVEGSTFTVKSAIACYVGISFDGGATYTELTATKTAEDNTYSFTLPALTGDFVIGIALRGDATGDGKINATDALRIQRYATNDPDEPYESNFEIEGLALLAADTTGDGKVNSMDALRIQRYVTNDPDDPYAEGTYELLWNVA